MTKKAVVELQLSIPRRFLYQCHMGSTIHMRMNVARGQTSGQRIPVWVLGLMIFSTDLCEKPMHDRQDGDDVAAGD